MLQMENANNVKLVNTGMEKLVLTYVQDLQIWNGMVQAVYVKTATL